MTKLANENVYFMGVNWASIGLVPPALTLRKCSVVLCKGQDAI